MNTDTTNTEQRMKTKKLKSKRNHIGRSPEELAVIFYEDALACASGRTFFDADICVDLIIDLPMFAGQVNPNDELKELIDDGDLDELFGKEITNEEQLFHTPGFIVRGTVQTWDWKGVEFDIDGRFEKGPCSDIGRYIIYGRGETLAAAYKSMVEMAVKRSAKNIKEVLGKSK